VCPFSVARAALLCPGDPPIARSKTRNGTRLPLSASPPPLPPSELHAPYLTPSCLCARSSEEMGNKLSATEGGPWALSPKLVHQADQTVPLAAHLEVYSPSSSAAPRLLCISRAHLGERRRWEARDLESFAVVYPPPNEPEGPVPPTEANAIPRFVAACPTESGVPHIAAGFGNGILAVYDGDTFEELHTVPGGVPPNLVYKDCSAYCDPSTSEPRLAVVSPCPDRYSHTPRGHAVSLGAGVDGGLTRLFASQAYDSAVHMWGADAWRAPRSLDCRAVTAMVVCVTPVGARVVVADEEGNRLRAFDPETGDVAHTLETTAAVVSLLSLDTCEGVLLLCGDAAGPMSVWDPTHWAPRGRLEGQLGESTTAVSFQAPGGGVCIVTPVGFSIGVWDLHTGSLLRTLVGHEGAVTGLVVYPSVEGGARLVSSSVDGSWCLWGAEGQGLLFRFRDEPYRFETVKAVRYPIDPPWFLDNRCD
jgi:hypothetical protein